MRLAVLSDVHGNALALDAVLARIRALAPDAIVNLGDCVSGPLQPKEALNLLQSTPMRHVRGNHDRVVGENDAAGLGRIDALAAEALDAAAKGWLAGLPATLAFDGVFCCHGVPQNDMDYLLEDVAHGRLVLAPDDAIAARLAGVDARLILCGHSHQPRVVRLGDGRTIVNPGSVGWPAYRDDLPPHVSEAGSPHARFAIVDVTARSVETTLHAIEYDWTAAARLATDRGRPDVAFALVTGRVPRGA